MRTKTTRNYASSIDDIVSASNIELDDTKSILLPMWERINLIYLLTLFNSIYLILEGLTHFMQ